MLMINRNLRVNSGFTTTLDSKIEYIIIDYTSVRGMSLVIVLIFLDEIDVFQTAISNC